MQDLAIALSVISSVLVIIYLLMAIFGSRKAYEQPQMTLTIQGRIVTRTIVVDIAQDMPTMHRTIEHR